MKSVNIVPQDWQTITKGGQIRHGVWKKVHEYTYDHLLFLNLITAVLCRENNFPQKKYIRSFWIDFHEKMEPLQVYSYENQR
jgi:hypothetical protein